MKKSLLVSVIFGCCSAMAQPLFILETNQVDGIDIEYRWQLDADFSNGTVAIQGISPKLFGEFEVPAVFVGTGPDGSTVLTVTELTDDAFADNPGLTSVTLPSTLDRIGARCFANCRSLAAVTIPYGVRSIGSRAFLNTIVTGLELPDTILNLEGNIAAGALFDLGNALADSSHFLVTEDGAVYNRDQTKLYSCPTRTEGTLAMPDTLTEIGADAFFGCFRLTYLNIPANVAVIGENAFNVAGIWGSLVTPAPESTPRLGNVFFNSSEPPAASDEIFDGTPAGLSVQTFSSAWPTTWKGRAITVLDPNDPDLPALEFKDAYGLTWQYKVMGTGIILVGLRERNSAGHTITNPMADGTKDSYKVLDLPDAINGSPIVKIADGALSNCTAAQYIRIPPTVIEIGAEAFMGCSSLVALDSIEVDPWNIEERTVKIPAGVRTLGRHPFAGLNVARLALPTTLTEIDGNPACGCAFLTAVDVAADNPNYASADGILYDKRQTRLVGMPANHPQPELLLPGSIQEIGVDALRGCAALSQIALPVRLASVAANGLRGCSGLKTLTFPGEVADLGPYAFADCEKLVSVTFGGAEPAADDTIFDGTPDVVVTANEGSFPNAPAWHGRPLRLNPSSSDPVGPQEFTDANGILWHYTISDGCAVLDADSTTPAIDPKTAGELVIPASLDGFVVKEIPADSFTRCGQITKITLPASVTDVAESAFNGCTSLVEIAVADGNIAYKANRKCLYTADGTTLVRVPCMTLLPCSLVRTVTRTRITTTTTPRINPDGTHDTVTEITAESPEQDRTQTAVVGDISFEMLLRNVTHIANYAFMGCNVFAPAVSTTTNVLSATASFTGDSVCVRRTLETVEAVESVVTALALPTSVLAAPMAFAGSGVTVVSGEEPPTGDSSDRTSPVPETLVAKSAYIGWIEQNGEIAGTVTLTTGAEKKGTFKISGSVIRPGAKKLTVKSLEQLNALGDVCLFRNLAKSKDKTEKASFNAFKGKSWTLAFRANGATVPATFGGATVLNATVGSYGKVTVKGTAADGTTLSCSAQMVRAEGRTLVPVAFSAYSSKGGFALLLEVLPDGSLALLSASPFTAIVAKKPIVLKQSLLAAGIVNGRLEGGLLLDEGLAASGYTIDWNKLGWKPRLTAKTGLFTGTITVFDAKGKKTRLTVRGAVVNSIGYGTAYLKNKGSWLLNVSR